MRRSIAFFVLAAIAIAAAPLYAGPPKVFGESRHAVLKSGGPPSKKPQNSESPVLNIVPIPKSSTAKKQAASSTHIQLIRILSKTFDKDTVQKIFSDFRLQLDRSVIMKSGGQYAPSALLTAESIERGKEFVKRNEWLLGEAEYKWKVDREVVAAVMRVETNFGKNLGSRSVFNTLYSIYMLNPRKRNFAFKELVAFLDLAGRYRWDPFEIKGSISGAIGLPQFIPTSYSNFAVDANSDGRADLFSEADAIYSVAFYLAIHGWGERFDQKRKAIYSYNHSWGYVDDVLSYAWSLKKSTPPHYKKD